MNLLKTVGYRLFALNYKLACLFKKKVDPRKVFAVATNDSSETGNIKSLTAYMNAYDDYEIYYYTNEDRNGAIEGEAPSFASLVFLFPWIMAESAIILMDNEFLPMAFLKVRPETKVIQLWHGTGSLKKFGQDFNTGTLLKYEKQMDDNIDDLIVYSDCQVEQYAKAFGVDKSKVRVTGLPRTDWLVGLAASPHRDRRRRIAVIKRKMERYLRASLEEKYIVLYAPTFRDNETEDPRIHLDIPQFLKEIPENVVLLVRLHPFVERVFQDDIDSEYKGRVYNVSGYRELNELLALSDILVTDYSSIFFDYAVFKRPMFFYADDIDDFIKNGRGLYMDYKNDMPGPVTDNVDELAAMVCEAVSNKVTGDNIAKKQAFVDTYYKYFDGESARRVYEECILK